MNIEQLNNIDILIQKIEKIIENEPYMYGLNIKISPIDVFKYTVSIDGGTKNLFHFQADDLETALAGCISLYTPDQLKPKRRKKLLKERLEKINDPQNGNIYKKGLLFYLQTNGNLLNEKEIPIIVKTNPIHKQPASSIY